MDVGFPAVSESERETLKLILEGRKRGEIREDMEVLCMMRSTRGDIDATMQAIDVLVKLSPANTRALDRLARCAVPRHPAR